MVLVKFFGNNFHYPTCVIMNFGKKNMCFHEIFKKIREIHYHTREIMEIIPEKFY